jgi:mannose-6-phosphate isomerase-like protein (cupin superfamily)
MKTPNTDPDAVTILDGTVAFLATAEMTGGQLLLTEQLFPRGEGPPLHTHPMTEVFHVLEGSVEVLVCPPGRSEPEVFVLGPGGTHVVPAMAVHTFRPSGSPVNRLIAAFTPAGTGEAFFREAGTPQIGEVRLPDKPQTSPEAVAHVLEAMARHEFLVV